MGESGSGCLIDRWDILSRHFRILQPLGLPSYERAAVHHIRCCHCCHAGEFWDVRYIPWEIISDSGPQYHTKFNGFWADWYIQHVTSSPRYVQSNGFVERQVRYIKPLIKKCSKASSDIHKALLNIRATPLWLISTNPCWADVWKTHTNYTSSHTSQMAPERYQELCRAAERPTEVLQRSKHPTTPTPTGTCPCSGQAEHKMLPRSNHRSKTKIDLTKFSLKLADPSVATVSTYVI